MMTRKDFEWIADRFGPLVFCPLTIEKAADELEEMKKALGKDSADKKGA